MRTSSNSRIALLGFVSLLAAGCGSGGGGGSDVAASLSGVFPATVFTGRTYEIEVSGVQTGWTTVPALDFGPGVVVDGAFVATPTALVVDVTVEDDAPSGPRVVTVGGLPYAGFEVSAPLEMTVENGRFEQGSTVFAHVRVLDRETPLPDGILVLYDDENVWGLSQSNNRADFDVELFVDPAAPPGVFNLQLDDSSAPLLRTRFILTDAGTVTARAPRTTLPDTVTFTGPDSGFHRYDAGPVAELVRFPFSSFGTTPVSPRVYHDLFSPFYRESHVGDVTPGPVAITKPGEVLWFYFRASDGNAASYTLDAPAATPAPTVAALEPNDTFAAAQAITPPMIVLDASFDGAGDVDVVKFTAAAGDVGKRVRVVTSGGALSAGRVIVRRADQVTQLGSFQIGGAHSDFASDPIPAAETIYISVLPNGFANSTYPYHLYVALE